MVLRFRAGWDSFWGDLPATVALQPFWGGPFLAVKELNSVLRFAGWLKIRHGKAKSGISKFYSMVSYDESLQCLNLKP